MTLAQRGKGNGNCVGVIYKLPNITTDLSKPPYLIYSVSLSPKKVELLVLSLFKYKCRIPPVERDY